MAVSDWRRFPRRFLLWIIDVRRGKDQPLTTGTRLSSSLQASNVQLQTEVKALRSQQELTLARLVEVERVAATAKRQLQEWAGSSPREEEANVVRLPSRPRGEPG